MNPGPRAGSAGTPATAGTATNPALVANWLLLCAASVLAVLVVGGITRLTHSGLSIVQWRPVSGVLPPLSAADWTALFGQYRASPEFRVVNSAMTVDEFKPIYWWEYAHRLLGRLAGLVFVVPAVWLALAGHLARPLAWRLAAIFLLGGLQGALGWYMVTSGLVDDPRVSPLRLAAHLGMALLIIGLLLWTAWTVRYPQHGHRPLPPVARIAPGVVFLMALSGALVAGTHAGLAYNTFPLMGDALVPPDLLRLRPWYENFLYNLATVQFLHRAFALVVLATLLAFWWRARAFAGTARARRWLLPALALQLLLGIVTLLSGVALAPAAAHQAGAVLLFGTTLWTVFRCARPASPSGLT